MDEVVTPFYNQLILIDFGVTDLYGKIKTISSLLYC